MKNILTGIYSVFILFTCSFNQIDNNNELGTVRVFYRPPSGRKTWELKSKVRRRLKPEIKIAEKTFLAVTIAELAMTLKESPFIKEGSIDGIIKRLKSMEQLSADNEIELRPLSNEGEKILSLLEEVKQLKKAEQ